MQFKKTRQTVCKRNVTVRLSFNFILGVKIYTLDREDRVSGGGSCNAVYSR
jgi:hypothetical protein